MSIQDIDYQKLRQSLIDCKNNINTNRLQVIVTELNDTYWKSESKNNLKESIEDLKDVDFKNLKKKIDEYLEGIVSIDEYQKIDKELTITGSKSCSSNPSTIYKTTSSNSEVYNYNNELEKLESKIKNL